ncbi:MAG: hypothetical protein JO067_07375 [Cupriavidus sp.]|nr:hypothetical protein [Cupriavidus sp.]
MSRLIWTLRRWSHLCKGTGLLGLLLAIGAGGAMLGSIHPQIAVQTARLQALRTEAAAIRTEIATAGHSVANHALPAASTYTVFLRDHAALARERSIELTEIDHASRPEAGQRLVRHTLRYTIDGPYPALRDYLAAIERIPGVRVETLAFVRSPNPDGAVNALVQISYLVEAGA